MCTYVTENVAVSGSAKGPEGWFGLSRATVYFDHPYHAPLEHSLNIDFAGPAEATRRVAVQGPAPYQKRTPSDRRSVIFSPQASSSLA